MQNLVLIIQNICQKRYLALVLLGSSVGAQTLSLHLQTEISVYIMFDI